MLLRPSASTSSLSALHAPGSTPDSLLPDRSSTRSACDALACAQAATSVPVSALLAITRRCSLGLVNSEAGTAPVRFMLVMAALDSPGKVPLGVARGGLVTSAA